MNNFYFFILITMSLEMSENMKNSFHYYIWWNNPIIYNDQLQITLYYDSENTERKSVDYYSVQDHAEEITDEIKIKSVFSEEIMQKYYESDLLKSCQSYYNMIKSNGTNELASTLLS
jgi:hypothetical protein